DGCTLAGNSAGNDGGGLSSRNSSQITADNCIIAFSTHRQAVHCDNGSATFTCCDIYGNEGGDWIGCIAGQYGTGGNFAANPLFCDLATGDLTLRSDSPCAPDNNPCAELIGAWPVGCSFDVLFEQLSFHWDGYEDIPYSPIGRFTYTFVPTVQAILNVAATLIEPGAPVAWIVRNLYLPGAETAAAVESLSVRFPLTDLGIEAGTPMDSLRYAWTISDTGLVDADSTAWLESLEFTPAAPVHQATDWAQGKIPEFDLSSIVPGTYTFHLPILGPLVIELTEYVGCDMPNIPLNSSTNPIDDGACGVAGATNSLLWLEDEHEEIEFPPEMRQAYEQLSNLMNRVVNDDGVSTTEFVRAKLDFIETYGLPIRIKFQCSGYERAITSTSGQSSALNHNVPPADITLGWLQGEVSSREDVEIGYGYYARDNNERRGGHVVIVTGQGEVNGVPFVVFKHDANQSNDTGCKQEATTIDVRPNGDIRLPGLTRVLQNPGQPDRYFDAYIEDVVSESYDASVAPPGDTHIFPMYCYWMRRTIPPGHKLVITYPEGPERCFNAAVWKRDRTVEPPRWRKELVWNFNRDDQRQFVNNESYPVTVAVHNDDDYRQGGNPIPYTVQLAIEAVGGKEESSPSNEDEYGGFSLGGRGDGADEFGDPAGPQVTFHDSLGCELNNVPGRLGSTGVASLTLLHDIAVWNQYWEALRLIVNVDSVYAPGSLTVDCPAAGLVTAIPIAENGEYVLDLGSLTPTAQFVITLTVDAGLDLTLDALGLAPADDILSGADNTGDIPRTLELRANQPNPFNPRTTIAFGLPRAGDVELTIYDLRGRRIDTLVDGNLPAGRHSVTWQSRDEAGNQMAAGVYIYRLRLGREVLTRKMVLVK
ncbi:MAG: FlgD immunoglobulin-like domain containing protein, partial [bacterium]